MPVIVDYPAVLQTLAGLGLKCLHYNGGVFGWPSGVAVHHAGWILKDDPTLTAEARKIAAVVSPPAITTLSLGLIQVWQQHLSGPMWIMPGSHWAYELTYGGQARLAELLGSVGIDQAELIARTEAAAIAFDTNEAVLAGGFVTNLLKMLNVTDFTAVFPEAETIALLHHHQQVWWTSRSAERIAAIAVWGAEPR